jgi:hypothetical protein
MKKNLFFLICLFLFSSNAFADTSMNEKKYLYNQDTQKRPVTIDSSQNNSIDSSMFQLNSSPIRKEFFYPMPGFKKNMEMNLPQKDNLWSLKPGIPPYLSLIQTSPYSVQQLCGITQVNSDIQNRIGLLTGRLKDRVSDWLSKASYYVPLMAEILAEKGVPPELVYLPLIESGFDTHAVSSAGAVGQWQFMSFTARRYGLKIDEWIDERRDPEKATQAAAAYLSDLYSMFGAWPLALSGYNAGEGRVMNAVSNAGTNNFWSLKQTDHLPKETRKYVPTFIAAAIIAHEPDRYGFNVYYQNPMDFDLVMIDSPMDIQVVAKLAETDRETVRRLNPELKKNSTPLNVDYYLVRIPDGRRKIFFRNYVNYPKTALLSASSRTAL